MSGGWANRAALAVCFHTCWRQALRQSSQAEVAFFWRQAMVGEEGANRCGCQLRMGWAQTGTQFLGAALGMLDSQDQNGDRFGGRGQLPLRPSGAPGGPLASRHVSLGGEIHKMALVLFALEGRMLMELPEKGAGVQVQALAQLSGGEAGGGLAHQGHDRLRQMAH